MIIIIKLISTFITSHSYSFILLLCVCVCVCVCVCECMQKHFRSSLLASMQYGIINIFTMLYFRFSEILHLINKSLHPWINISPFPPPHSPWGASLLAQLVKNQPAMQETPVQFLVQEGPLEKG